MRSSSFLAVACGFFSVISALQTPAQLAAQIPSCVLPCDEKGFAAVGCSDTDYACHCAHSDELKGLVGGCLKNSTCTTAELTTFGGLVAEICQNLNVTAPSNGSATASPTPTGSVPSVIPISRAMKAFSTGGSAVVAIALVSGLMWLA